MPGAADRLPLDVEEQIEHLGARKGAGATAPLVAQNSGAAVGLVEFDGVAARALDETLDRHGTFIFPRHVAIETAQSVALPRILRGVAAMVLGAMSYSSGRATERRIAQRLWIGT
jgi:hypothetical protein